MERMKRKEEEFLCRGHILNALSSPIYTAHRHIQTAKELWTTLQEKYRIEESSWLESSLHVYQIHGMATRRNSNMMRRNTL
ncbi:hypothetical protein BVC80_7971g5 [Macleaya cordata]|uniref:Uncharacterized protein n=1 Tax=Macleaya cordata TaxID=56857 RepID=A0A200QCK0_MACCD|nr:hypothetical protein BVC80_7971g5 [Macleaya cordata]